jgi:predicted metal-dependent HD superfamily phosphohydrolase
MDYKELQLRTEEHVRSYFAAQHDDRLVYHNLQHTEGVVRAAKQIAEHHQLNDQDYFTVVTAAWFHDVGYFTDPPNHEADGAAQTATFLKELQVPSDIIAAIEKCIMATKMPQSPEGLLEQIVCDADLFHLGTDDFAITNKALRKEMEMLKGIKISKDKWRSNAIRLLETHHYHTDYARLLLNDKKQKNLEKLKQKEESNKEEEVPKALPIQVSLPIAGTPESSASKPKKDKNRPDRGIETMFRTTSGNNQRLSDMADNKAHIMITVNSIILSAVISLLLGKIPKQEYLAIPTYLILAVSVSTIIFSILATRPSLPNGVFTRQDVEDKKVNLLFFGNFYKMNLDEYSDGMWKVMADSNFLYGSLIKDVYSQGVVLGRKYRLLRISYSIFMFGLILAVLSFVVASAIHADL